MARSISSRRASGPRIRDRGWILFHEFEDGGISDEAAFDDFGHAGNDLVAGQGVQGVQVRQHTGGRVEGAHQVLAFGGVDAGLAAHGGVHHAQQAGGHVDDLDAAQPGGGHKAGEVGDRAAAHGDDGVRTGEVVLAQDLPAEGGDLDVLAFFGVGDFRGQRGEAGGRQFVPDGVAGEAQRPGVDDQHAPDPLPQEFRKAAEQSPSDDDVVVLGRRTRR